MNGKPTKVLYNAPKNGFFFTIDRCERQADRRQTLCRRDQLGTGTTRHGPPDRKIPRRASTDRQPFIAVPGALGAHNWHPMSYNPATGPRYSPRSRFRRLSRRHGTSSTNARSWVKRRHLAEQDDASRRQAAFRLRSPRPPAARCLRPADGQGRMGGRSSRGMERRHDDHAGNLVSGHSLGASAPIPPTPASNCSTSTCNRGSSARHSTFAERRAICGVHDSKAEAPSRLWPGSPAVRRAGTEHPAPRRAQDRGTQSCPRRPRR